MIPANFVLGIATDTIDVSPHPEGLLGIYEEYSAFYFDDIVRNALELIRTIDVANVTDQDPFRVSTEINDSPELSVDVKLVDDTSVQIGLSIGTLHALHDCCVRAFCSDQFFNNQGSQEQNLADKWPGCRTIELSASTSVQPKFRFANYEPKQSPKRASLSFSDQFSEIGLYLEKVPLDESRLQLSSIALKISLSWILLHEENHLRNGHLHYIRDFLNSTDKDDLSLMAEHYVAPFSEREPSTSLICEFQADKAATKDTISIWMNMDLDAYFPTYANESDLWQLRFILSSIGIAILVLDRDRLEIGSDPAYPPMKVRYCNVIQSALSEIIQTKVIKTYEANGPEAALAIAIDYGLAVGDSLYDISEVRDLINLGLPSASEDEGSVSGEYLGARATGIVYVTEALNSLLGVSGIPQLFDDLKASMLSELQTNDMQAHFRKHGLSSLDNYVRDAEQTMTAYNGLAAQNKETYWELFRSYRERCTPWS